jgi:hypothetical protein
MGRARKSPAMPLYGKDAWTDEEFAARPWDLQGLFWRLAFWQWMEGSIPDDVDKIITVVGKPRETKRLFKVLVDAEFFVAYPNEAGRLYNLTTHGHREDMLADRAKRQFGADKTNAQSAAQRTGERPAERNGERVASRAADANAITSEPATEKPGEGAGEGRELTPQQAAVKAVVDALEDSTRGFLLPTAGLIARWVKEFGVDLIVATIRAEGAKGNLDGRSASYLHQCIESYKRRPHGITSGNRNAATGTDGRATSGDAGNSAPTITGRRVAD